MKQFIKTISITFLALIFWSPLNPYGETPFVIFGFGLNWIAMVIGLGAVFLADDFINFRQKTKAKHYVLAVLLCPFWPVARFFVLK